MAIALAALGLGLAALAESSGSSSTNRPPAQKTISRVTLPNVLGQTATEAVSSLWAAGLSPQERNAPGNAPVGTVITESPRAGSSVRPRAIVALTIASGPIALPASTEPPATTIVPNVVEIFQQSRIGDIPAIRALEGHELKWKTTGEYVGPNGACGDLIAQSPPAGTRIAVWSDVWLTYGTC